MSLTHTADEAINQTASLLGRYVPGEALGAVEHDTIDRSLDNVLAELVKIVVIDKETIPNIYFETLCRQVAVYAAAMFSNIPKDMQEVLNNEQRLRYLVALSPTYEVLATNYF
jgi:hypothetical protein